MSRKTPACPRCGNTGLGRDDIRNGLDVEEAVRCIRCGWRVSRTVFVTVAPDPDIVRDADVLLARTKGPCSVIGCEGKVNLSANGSGMCPLCYKQDYAWRFNKRKTQPPLIPWPLDPSRKMRNPEYGKNIRG